MRVESANTEYRLYRIPALCMTKQGVLLAAYECRKDVSDWAQIDIKIIRSEDDGATWQEVLTLYGQGHTMNNPVWIVDGDTVHFLYCRNYRQLLYRRSEDGGKSFSAERDLTDVCCRSGFAYTVLAVGPGHGIAHQGCLIAPMWFANNPNDSKAHHPSFVATLYSQDGGETWNLGEKIGVDLFVNGSECAMAVNAQDCVVMSIRNENEVRLRGIAVSETGYSHWQNVHFASTLPDPICEGSMTSERGVLYHVNCASKTGRENLTLKISADGFETAQEVFIDDVGEYSDIVVQGGIAYILYERDSWNDGLYFKKIQL